MTALNAAMTKLLPRHWTRHWTEPDVDAEALLLGLSQTLETLAMRIDGLVYAVQSEELTPEAAITQVQEQALRALKQMVPGVEVRQRAWQPPKIGYFIELAEYQLTIERLLNQLGQLASRIAVTTNSGSLAALWPASVQEVAPPAPVNRLRAVEREEPPLMALPRR